MSANGLDEYWVPEHVKDYLRKLGLVLPLDDMEPWIRSWDDWMSARGEFYDYRDKDGMGRVYAVHRRSIHPAMRVCKEWGSLLLNEEVRVVCDNQKATDWINTFFSSTNFMNAAQATVVRAFGLGTGAWALWLDLDKRKVRIRHYDARMVIPLSWDEDGITECAFVMRTFYRGKAVALQMLGDLTGFGISYLDMNESRGYVKTATEVSSDNSALMRNIKRHENSLEGAIVSIARAVMHASRGFGESIPNGGETRIQFDDSIIQDTAAEKEQDMAGVGVTMAAWEYRAKWYGEDEKTA